MIHGVTHRPVDSDRGQPARVGRVAEAVTAAGAGAGSMGRMLSTLVSFAAEAERHVELPVPPFVYGLISLAIFTMMLGALFAFRQAATKVPTSHNTVAHGDHDGPAPEAGDHH